jgi:hypothetical protein
MMKKVLKTPGFFHDWKKDTRGSFALGWAMSAMAIIMMSGAAYDYTQLSKAKAIAQVAADNMALAASVAVDQDNDNRYNAAPATYSYRELGGPQDDFTNSMRGSVEYEVDDDGDGEPDLLARATVNGTYQPAFMSIVPAINGLNFSAISDVAYAQAEGSPASIFFVTDNSGSMRSRDTSGVRKISSLKTSMKAFMVTLGTLSNHGDDIFRTALFPYSSALINSRIINPKWGTLSNGNINNMRANGGTRSTAALRRVKTKFALENNIHELENGTSEPLKFLVFMSDGANNGAQQVCGPDYAFEYWVDTYPGENNRVYCEPRNWFDNWVDYYPGIDGPGYISPENISSLVECTAMKNAGVIIYAIAYDVAENERALAEQFMQDCSSGIDDYYQYASNGTDLQRVFDAIGESIVKEVIRIKR